VWWPHFALFYFIADKKKCLSHDRMENGGAKKEQELEQALTWR
jgi:cytochrome c2